MSFSLTNVNLNEGKEVGGEGEGRGAGRGEAAPKLSPTLYANDMTFIDYQEARHKINSQKFAKLDALRTFSTLPFRYYI